MFARGLIHRRARDDEKRAARMALEIVGRAAEDEAAGGPVPSRSDDQEVDLAAEDG